jgi:hypothetical protein
VTRDRTPRELRERMEHVAARRRQPTKPAPRRSTVPPPDTNDRDVSVVPIRRAGAASERRSRLETLVAWGRWELISVPARRLRWLRAVISPGDSRTGDPRRGD